MTTRRWDDAHQPDSTKTNVDEPMQSNTYAALFTAAQLWAEWLKKNKPNAEVASTTTLKPAGE